MTKNFRAFEKKNKRYLDNFLISMSGNIHECFADSSHSYNRDLSLVKNEPVDAVLEQWTGYLDVNDIKIFENDIVKGSVFDFQDPTISFIIYREHGFYVKDERFGYEGECLWNWNNLEVIGNRNLNPELLEAKK